MEPQTIINKSYIQDSVANTSDYTNILAIAPSLTGMDINGPGLSDGNVKNTLAACRTAISPCSMMAFRSATPICFQ